MKQTIDKDIKVQSIKKLTSYLLHKHYCENDVEAVIDIFDDRLSWFGTGENEYAVGTKTVSAIFQQFAGLIPQCNIWDEEYDVIDISPDVYLCSGRAWIAPLPSSNMYLCVHQRITAVFRWANSTPRCCHVHISNPYTEMAQQEVGFPLQMGQHTYEYLHRCINEEKKKLKEEIEVLQRMSFEDLLTGLFNQNKFHQTMHSFEKKALSQLGVASIDLNGLKKVNDQMGHAAGDSLIRRTADHIACIFAGKCYRIGGDEFAVIDTELKKDTFQAAIAAMNENMMRDGISVSVGISWRCGCCNIKEQFCEADRQMYQVKSRFYSSHGTRK